MSDYGDNVKYKWTPESTTLLVSVWTDKQVQKQLEYAQRPQLIWESVARYMKKKGYVVSAKQCRSRMKQVLVCYREAKRSGTRAGVEQYYDCIDKVLKNKREEQNDLNGVDTVDSVAPVKSPPKDVKTNKNLKMRFNKYNEPIESLIRTEALSPTWHLAREEDYPDSPESNETVLAQPYRTFSPTRDAATNTLNDRSRLLAKGTRRASTMEEQPIRDSRILNSVPNNRFGEMLYQNAVQNVQNQIIQENMQQRNLLHNRFIDEEGRTISSLQPDQLNSRNTVCNPFVDMDEFIRSKQRNGQASTELPTRMENQLEQGNYGNDNRAMPQEPRRGNYAHNLAMNCKHYKGNGNPAVQSYAGIFRDQRNFTGETRQRSTGNYSPVTADNLNEAFCQTHKNDGNHNLNDSYDQRASDENNDPLMRDLNATTITNNATFNDDTISIEFIEDSPSPSDNGIACAKSVSGNSDGVPNAPVRKKRGPKLEQLVLNAITSQSDVVNKILAAQDAMVSRFLDLDRDRQNRLENRLDHLMSVVHANAMKSNPSERETANDGLSGLPMSSEPLITSLVPPPCPGVIPPKLDLVPPKPCRVPCTTVNANVELVNRNPANQQTRPGVVSPVRPKPGAIWTKLGPVSQSPFVKAQQQFEARSIPLNGDPRTQSSAERKIAREMSGLTMDRRALIVETEKFLENERMIEEQSENAKILTKMGQEVAARKKLFSNGGEPNAGIILTAAFLDAERYVSSTNCPSSRDAPGYTSLTSEDNDEDEELILLADQVDNYERLRRLNGPSRIPNEAPCDSSTPAKISAHLNTDEREICQPRQTIQQLAELVMKSARWRDIGVASGLAKTAKNPFSSKNQRKFSKDDNAAMNREMDDQTKTLKRAKSLREKGKAWNVGNVEAESRKKALGWLRDRYSYDRENRDDNNARDDDDPRETKNRREIAVYDEPPLPKSRQPIGFTMDNLMRDINVEPSIPVFNNRGIGFNPDLLGTNNNPQRRNVAFADLEEPRALMEKTGQVSYPRQRRRAPSPPINRHQGTNRYTNNREQYSTLPLMHRNMIDRYVQDSQGPVLRKKNDNGEQDSEEDEEFLDTTTSMQPQSRKTSLTSNGSAGKAINCVVS